MEENEIRDTIYDEFKRKVSMACNEECSCGGKGPNDPGVCQACMVYHHLFSGTHGYLFGNDMNIETTRRTNEV